MSFAKRCQRIGQEIDIAMAVNDAFGNGSCSALASTIWAPGARSRARLTTSSLWSRWTAQLAV
jgi:hypothetical protein